MPSDSTTIRINSKTHKQLQILATMQQLSMQTVLETALEVYRRQVFLEGLSADFAKLKEKTEDWQEELEERKIWELTLTDGLEEI